MGNNLNKEGLDNTIKEILISSKSAPRKMTTAQIGSEWKRLAGFMKGIR